MVHVLLVIHLIVTIVMIGLILLQRSEGGGLGIGGGGGGLGAFASPRATANALSRATMICFALFVGLSLLLAILSGHQVKKGGLIDQLNKTPVVEQTVPVAPTTSSTTPPSVDSSVPSVGAVEENNDLATPEEEKPAVPMTE